MKYFIIAGERSGDLHAGRIVDALRERQPNAVFQGWGGDKMMQAGVTLRKHHRETATMGFLEVLTKLNYFRNLIVECKEHIAEFEPDAVIYVDFSAFNLRVAPFVKKRGITSYYFITPKVWAWNTKRAYKLERLTDHRLVILPFEVAFFQQRNISATYVGNPLTERIRSFIPATDFLDRHALDPTKPIMALLPGSRQQEIKRILPTMIALTQQLPNYHWVLSGVRSVPGELYQPAIDAGIPMVWEDSYNLMHAAETAIVASGTATLETALFGTPQIVVYKTSKLSAAIVRAVIKIPHVSLPNLIAGEEVVPELLQKDFSLSSVQEHFEALQTPEGRAKQQKGYQKISQLLGDISTPVAVADYISES